MQFPDKVAKSQQNPPTFIYKYVWLNTPATNKKLKELLNRYADKIFMKPDWDLTESFCYNQMDLIFPYIAKAPCQKLFMLHKQKYSIFKMIRHVDFSLLTFLKLSFNRIENIQSIAFLRCPKLETLDLSYNKITNFRPLFKTVFKELVNLKIDHNTCYELSLCRMFTNQENKINFEYSSHKRYKEQVLFSHDEDSSSIKSSEKSVYSECSGSIMDIVSFFVKLQNSKVAKQMIHQMNKQDKVSMTVLRQFYLEYRSKKRRKKICDIIVRKFSNFKTLMTYCKKNPLTNFNQNLQAFFNQVLPDYQSDESNEMKDSLQIYREQIRIKNSHKST